MSHSEIPNYKALDDDYLVVDVSVFGNMPYTIWNDNEEDVTSEAMAETVNRLKARQDSEDELRGL